MTDGMAYFLVACYSQAIVRGSLSWSFLSGGTGRRRSRLGREPGSRRRPTSVARPAGHWGGPRPDMALCGRWPWRWRGAGSAFSLRGRSRSGIRPGLARAVHVFGRSRWWRSPGDSSSRCSDSETQGCCQRERSSKPSRLSRACHSACRFRRIGTTVVGWSGQLVVGHEFAERTAYEEGRPTRGFTGAVSAGRIGYLTQRGQHG